MSQPFRRSSRPTRLALTALAIVGVVPAAAMVISAPAVLAAPQPDPVPTRWELRIEPGHLRVTTSSDPNHGSRAYAYFTYDVTNLSGEDLTFAPSFTLTTDQGHVLRSGRDVPREVAQDILGRFNNPLMEDERSIRGQILQGKENAKTGLVIWPLPSTDVDQITVFAAGFSGETASVTRPDNGETVVLRKTMMLRHATPGEVRTDIDAPLKRIERRWVMR